MDTNKLGTLFLVSVLAIAGIGISYAGWTDVITVSGTVQTGTVEYKVTEYSGTWVWKLNSEHTKEVHYDEPINIFEDPNGYYGNNDYTLVSHSYAFDDDSTDADVDFKFINLYPCVDFEVDFKFEIGSIPVHLTGTGLTWSGQTVNDVSKEWINGIDDLPAPTITEEIFDESGAKIWPGITDLVQLHPGKEYHWKLTIHIPQHNSYMNAYAEGSCSFNIIQWSDECNGQTTDPKLLDIPPGPHYDALKVIKDKPGYVGYGSASNPPVTPNTYFDIELSNLNEETLDIYNGVWPGFCADSTTFIAPNQPYDIKLFDSRGTLPGFASDDEQWDKINYLLNYYKEEASGANWQTIQAAIWHFADATPGGDFEIYKDVDLTAYNAIIDDVEANGDGFSPSQGQWLAIVFLIYLNEGEFNDNVQLGFIVVDP